MSLANRMPKLSDSVYVTDSSLCLVRAARSISATLGGCWKILPIHQFEVGFFGSNSLGKVLLTRPWASLQMIADQSTWCNSMWSGVSYTPLVDGVKRFCSCFKNSQEIE